MKTKRIISAALAVLMIATSFTACGKKDNAEGDTTTSTIANEAINKDGVVAEESTTAVNEDVSETTTANNGESGTTGKVDEKPTDKVTTTTRKNNQNTVTTTRRDNSNKMPTTTRKQETTTKAPTTTQPQVRYLTYVEVMECVAEAEKYAISRGFKINKDKNTSNSSYKVGADSGLILTKKAYTDRIKDWIDDRYDEVIDEFGYFVGGTLNIVIVGPYGNPDGSDRYIAYACY